MHGITLERYHYRAARTRRKIRASQTARPRLSIYRASKHIYAQIIDDAKSQTLVAVSSLSSDLKGQLKSGGNIPAAEAVGKLVAEKTLAKGIKQIVFDRGGHVYHGRIKALAEAARKAGLDF
ncbi:MAG: 50S ribosomal protein L18 [Elusimicrobiota bacterium]|jgi:large subunit ribosomal protein L18